MGCRYAKTRLSAVPGGRTLVAWGTHGCTMSSTDETLQLKDFLCFAVYSANHAFNRVYKPMLDRLGLTYPQYIAMVTLWSEEGLTVGQIGDRVLLETNTLTPLLKRLELQGLVQRQRRQDDERIVEIYLTKAGDALRSHCACIPAELAATTHFPLEKATALATLLDELLTGLREQTPDCTLPLPND